MMHMRVDGNGRQQISACFLFVNATQRQAGDHDTMRSVFLLDHHAAYP
jgi:hypothetical protein